MCRGTNDSSLETAGAAKLMRRLWCRGLPVQESDGGRLGRTAQLSRPRLDSKTEIRQGHAAGPSKGAMKGR